MARIRSIKPEYWADEDFAVSVPNRDARLLYVGLWNLADEHGRVRGDPRYVKGQLFAYDDDLTPKMIDALLDELAAARKVQRYRSGSGAYLFLPNLAKHQRLEAAKVASRLPAPPDPDESAPMATVGTDESAPGADESALLYVAGSREPVAGGRGAPLRSARTKGTRIPADFTVTPEMVTWAREKCPQVDGKAETEKFVNHWTAKSGKDATKLDWPATWRNWMLNSRDRYGARASPGTDLTPHNGTRPSTAELRAGAGIDIANRLKQQRLDAERDTG